MSHPRHLGDGLYVEFDGYAIRLYAARDGRPTTHTGIPIHEVFLEPEVLREFQKYVAGLNWAAGGVSEVTRLREELHALKGELQAVTVERDILRLNRFLTEAEAGSIAASMGEELRHTLYHCPDGSEVGELAKKEADRLLDALARVTVGGKRMQVRP